MEYDYKQLGSRFYPVVPVKLEQGSHVFDTHALIDSGAMLSLFQLEAMKSFNVNYKSGTPTKIASIHGELTVYVHKLRMRIGDIEFPCRIGFSKDFKAHLNIIGRTDFFEMFKITFDEKNKKLFFE